MSMEQTPTELSIVVPVYRSAASLAELHERLAKALPEVARDYEILFVDDASPDETWSVLEGLRASDPRVRLLQLMRNSGQQRALLCGMARSRGEIVVTMDDDLQQRPEEIGVLVETLRRHDVDVVFGRFPVKRKGPVRRAGSRLVKALSRRTLGVPGEIELNSFLALRGQVAREVARRRNPNPVVGFLVFQVTRRVMAADVHHDPRKHGRSGYGFRDLVDLFAAMVMDYSDWPLRAVGSLGLILAAGSFAVGVYTGVTWMMGRIGVSGFTTTVLLITFLSGAILVSLGVIGGYLVRVLRQAGQSDLPVVRRELD